MDDSTRIRLIGLGLQLTLLGGFATTLHEEAGIALALVGTLTTGLGII